MSGWVDFIIINDTSLTKVILNGGYTKIEASDKQEKALHNILLYLWLWES